jgi:hypothetical protein
MNNDDTQLRIAVSTKQKNQNQIILVNAVF